MKSSQELLLISITLPIIEVHKPPHPAYLSVHLSMHTNIWVNFSCSLSLSLPLFPCWSFLTFWNISQCLILRLIVTQQLSINYFHFYILRSWLKQLQTITSSNTSCLFWSNKYNTWSDVTHQMFFVLENFDKRNAIGLEKQGNLFVCLIWNGWSIVD